MLEVVVEVLFEVICGVTGHVVLWVLTLGRRPLFSGRDDVAILVGLLFWVVVVVGVCLILFR
jgi:hypothetical protein